ncbi:MAG TPA: asparagine synthase-related protein [Thermoleophilaceae bacterium]
MTEALTREFTGVHDRREPPDPDVLRRAMPGATVVQAGSLALACPAPAWHEEVCLALAGRVRRPGALRERLGVDPEVGVESALALGYARWGNRLLEHIAGPFALVAWMRHEQRGILAQDQLGGRSLFVFTDGPRVFFATEVRLLLNVLRRRPPPDELAVVHHIVEHNVPEGRMLFHGVRRIGGGRHLELTSTGLVEGRHWAPRYRPPLRLSRADLATRWRDELSSAVEDAVSPAERPSALLLSGGLDSSVVAALAARQDRELQAVSAAFPSEPELDETAWAERVAEHAGIQLTTVPIDDRDPLEAARTYVDTWQLPLAVPGIIIEQPLISEARRLGAGLVLDGQGGDELFGAAHFLVADYLRHIRPLAAWRLSQRNPWLGATPPLRHVWQVFASLGIRGAIPPRLHEWIRDHRSPERFGMSWLRPRFLQLYLETEDSWEWKRLDGPRWWAWLADMLTRARETADLADYLRRRATMLGVQARSPLLDLTLVELALRIPPETNFDPITSRPLVREALSGALPPEVLARRDKNDFSALHHRALTSPENLRWIQEELREDTAEVGAYIDVRRFHREYLEHPPAVGGAGWRPWAVYVWNVVTAEMWLRNEAT